MDGRFMLTRPRIQKSVVGILVAALCGAIVGGVVSSWWFSSQLQDASEFSDLAHRAQLQEEAFEQYRNGEPHVAIYVLQRSLKESIEYAASQENKRGTRWDVALTYARLGKMYLQLGEPSNANIHFNKAIEAFAHDGWSLRDVSELRTALELIDKNRLVEAMERYGTVKKIDRARPAAN
jgi:tetratricopeptide (TPR) repeat protein